MGGIDGSRRQFLSWACRGALALPAATLAAPAQATQEPEAHPARHWESLEELRVHCKLCPRECKVADRERGYCGVRENRGGQYVTLVHSRPCAVHVDPIEKKPLFHFLPGSKALSIATAGCNIECRFCQNWRISQFRPEQVDSIHLPPEPLVEMARQTGSRSIAYTYSEPVIFYEYMYDAARLGAERGIHSVMITNGYIHRKPMRELCEHLSAVKVDLKAFSEKFYRDTCSGELKPVLEVLKLLKDLGTWTEIVVLIVPTLNDSPEEARAMADWIAGELGPEVPVHFTRFHPAYKIRNLPPTPVPTLERCREIAMDRGLHYVYAGNVPGHPGENTYCPGCDEVVVRRLGFVVSEVNVEQGRCGSCGHRIAGIWR
ncbi:MAG: AmmeMemoRadiSam system radical SAM enzyme [Planctomycetota bacterium]|jgi:pyruvate formate lyase activating enzyme